MVAAPGSGPPPILTAFLLRAEPAVRTLGILFADCVLGIRIAVGLLAISLLAISLLAICVLVLLLPILFRLLSIVLATLALDLGPLPGERGGTHRFGRI
jgi:hypothetical protein